MKKTILTIISLLISAITLACSCDWGGNFIKVSKYAELIVKGKIITHEFHSENGKSFQSLKDFLEETENENYTESIIIEVIETIRGEEKWNRIEIYGSDGADCLIGLQHFKIGKTYIFSLVTSVHTDYSALPKVNRLYSIEGCSENWLEYLTETNEVKGLIKGRNTKKLRIYKYDKLKRKIT